jgi:UDP-N-acetylglucosamine 4,6-dehydratase
MSKIFISGATGSFGVSFVDYLLKSKKNLKKIIIFSRDELKQYNLKKKLLKYNKKLRFFIGDIRDIDRLRSVISDSDTIIHAAALKQVDTCEYNPEECIKTNILGSNNLIKIALEKRINKSILISTDKAVNPINLYGACKLAAEKIFISANTTRGNSNCKFSVVRYGNVINSRGSVIPLFLDLFKKGEKIPLTDERMTRFFITLKEAVGFVDNSIKLMTGGEIFVPKIKSILIKDIILALGAKYYNMGLRVGEKIHETLVSEEEKLYSTETANSFVIRPLLKAKKVGLHKSYNSFENIFVKRNEIKKILVNL